MNPNFDNENLFSAAKKLGLNDTDAKNLKSAVGKQDVSRLLDSLSPEQASKLNDILKDKAKTEQILSSNKAQQLLKALFKDGGKNG